MGGCGAVAKNNVFKQCEMSGQKAFPALPDPQLCSLPLHPQPQPRLHPLHPSGSSSGVHPIVQASSDG